MNFGGICCVARPYHSGVPPGICLPGCGNLAFEVVRPELSTDGAVCLGLFLVPWGTGTDGVAGGLLAMPFVGIAGVLGAGIPYAAPGACPKGVDSGSW